MSFLIPPVGQALGFRPYLMADPAITGRVIAAIAETLSVDKASITPDTKFEDLIAGDSTKIVELVQAVEIEFDDELKGEPIPDATYRKWVKVQDGIDYLEGLGK